MRTFRVTAVPVTLGLVAATLLTAGPLPLWAIHVPGGSGTWQRPDDVEGVLAALSAYASAITAMDVQEAGSWVTEDFLIFEGAGVNRGWADYRDHHLVPEIEMFDVLRFEFDDIEAEVQGRLAWATFNYSTHIEMPERVVDSAGVGTAVLVKGDDDRWRLRHLHTTPDRRR